MTPCTQGVDHIGLAVMDLKTTLPFFTETLGFQEVGGRAEYPAVFVSDGTVMITLWQTEEDPYPFDRMANVGLHHVALRVENEKALQAVFRKLEQTPDVVVECPPIPLESGNGSHMMCLEPGGIRIEFIWRSGEK